VTVARLTPDELVRQPDGEPSAAIRARVEEARRRQAERFGRPETNARVAPGEIRDSVRLEPASEAFLHQAATRLNISGRAYDRVLKVGRTIADLEGDDLVRKAHLAEAIQYRSTIQ
jgi:magnesium chelatase family protein